MNFQGLLTQFRGNAETLLLGTALHYVQSGKADITHLDADAAALSLSSALQQLEAEHPGISAKYGWVRIDDAAALSNALTKAMLATPPAGLQ